MHREPKKVKRKENKTKRLLCAHIGAKIQAVYSFSFKFKTCPWIALHPFVEVVSSKQNGLRRYKSNGFFAKIKGLNSCQWFTVTHTIHVSHYLWHDFVHSEQYYFFSSCFHSPWRYTLSTSRASSLSIKCMAQIKSANVEYGFDPPRDWISASVGQTISSCEGERSSKYSFLMPYRRPRWLQFFTLFVRCFWFKSSHTFSITSKSSIKSFSKESSETITKIIYIMFSLPQYYYLFHKFVH